MKKKLLLMLASSLVLGTVTLTSCKGKIVEEIIKELNLENEGKTVLNDFKVTATLKKGDNSYNLLWSSNSEYFKVATEAKDDSYDISVTHPEDSIKTVVLTAELEVDGAKATKDFTFKVSPVTIDNFINYLEFDSNIDSDSELPKELKIGSDVANISWKSQNEDIVTISDDRKVNVVTSSPFKGAELEATFTYKNKTKTALYPVAVICKEAAKNLEDLSSWYNLTSNNQELRGYVVAKDVYYELYGNTSVYISSATSDGGYFGYHVNCDKETYDKLTFGTLVSIKDVSATSFQGLIETKAGGTVEIIEDAKKKTEEELIKPIDNDLIANKESIFFKESSLVSLTGWKVKKVSEEAKDPTKYENYARIITLTRKVGNIDFDVVVMANKYLFVDDEAKNTLATTCRNLKVGDIVNIKGVLGYEGDKDYRGAYFINITSADSIVKAEDQTEIEYADGIKVADAIKSAEIPTNLIETEKIDLPTTIGGVTVTWAFLNENKSKTIAIKNGKLVVNPTDEVEEVSLVGLFSSESYEVYQHYNIDICKASPYEVVDRAKSVYMMRTETSITLHDTYEYELQMLDPTYGKVEITYNILNQVDAINGGNVSVARMTYNKLIIDSNKLLDDTNVYQIKLLVTFSYGNAYTTYEYTLTAYIYKYK